MTHPYAICLGEILFDCLADQAEKTFNKVESWTTYPGGAPANVACGLVNLGTTAALISSVGEDTEGKKLVQILQEIGVDTSGRMKISEVLKAITKNTILIYASAPSYPHVVRNHACCESFQGNPTTRA